MESLINESNSPGVDYAEDGVDLTLIRWMLSLTPAQRLDALEHHINFIQELRARNPQLSTNANTADVSSE